MKKIFKKIFRVFLVLLSFIALYLMAVFLLPLFSVKSDEKDSDEITIYILTNGVHTDIVCHVKNDVIDWAEIVPFENTVSKRTDYNYVAFG